jgi:hypothetical protein
VIFFAVIIVGYGALEAKNLAEGPIVSIISPTSGDVATSSVITIKGVAKNVSFITLNGDQIFTDENGNFSEDRIISTGYNVITVNARDKFGKKVEKVLYITYKP